MGQNNSVIRILSGRKVTLLIILLLATGAAAFWMYTSGQNIREKVIRDFSKGDVETLASYFSSDVELELFDREEYTGITDTKNRLTSFFKQYPPKTFKIRHESANTQNKESFLIGLLQTEAEIFRVTLLIKDEQQLKRIAIVFEPPVR